MYAIQGPKARTAGVFGSRRDLTVKDHKHIPVPQVLEAAFRYAGDGDSRYHALDRPIPSATTNKPYRSLKDQSTSMRP